MGSFLLVLKSLVLPVIWIVLPLPDDLIFSTCNRFVVVFVLVWVFWDHYVSLAGLKVTEINPPLPPPEPVLKVYTITPIHILQILSLEFPLGALTYLVYMSVWNFPTHLSSLIISFMSLSITIGVILDSHPLIVTQGVCWGLSWWSVIEHLYFNRLYFPILSPNSFCIIWGDGIQSYIL